MDILTYINRMNQIYGDKTQVAPVYNTQKYLQGGRVQYKPGGLVEPGVMYYGKRTQQEVNAIKQNIRNYYNNAIKNKETVFIKKILDNVKGSNDMMIRRVLNDAEIKGLPKQTKYAARET